MGVLKIHPRDPGALYQALTYLVTAPWLAPLERSVYVTPYYAGAALVMCVPFFFSSYYVEYWAGKKYFKAEDTGRLKGWCWSANLASYACIVLLLAGLIVGSLYANRNQAWLPGDSQAFKSPNSKYVLVSTRLAPNETFPEWALDLKDLANHQSTPVTHIRSGRAFACWSPGGDKFFLNLEQWGQTPPKVCLLYFYVPPLGRINLSEEAVRQNLFDPKLRKRPYESYFVRGDKWLDNDRVQLTVEAWYTAHPKADETRSLSDSFSYVYEIGKGFTFLK
jgi:hypothetical protein